jgi:hypothetical protein
MKVGMNVKLAIVAGILNCIIWYFAARSVNFTIEAENYRYIATLVLLLLGVFLSVYFERKENGGFLEFKQGLKAGLLYAIVLGAILGIFNYFYYSMIAPDVIPLFKSEQKKLMIAQKLSENDILKNLEVVDNYFGSFRMAMSTVIIGLILSLIAAATFRRKNPGLPFSAN